MLVAVATAAIAACGGTAQDPSDGAGADPRTPRATALPETASARAVEPVAGETAATADRPVQQRGDDAAPAPTASATGSPGATTRDNGPTSDAAVSEADVLKNGIALPPIEAPGAVRDIIEAGNYIARTPYLWGGGHGKWLDKGYDCSGSISYALARAGLLDAPLDSGRLMGWGAPGKGTWVTIYSNPGHVFMVVAGVRFDTSGTRVSGSRWQKSMRGDRGYVARHPPGL